MKSNSDIKTKILYVDDEDINLKLFEMSFDREFEVITCLSAEEGLDIINRDNNIAILLSDLRMPGMDGLTFIREVKKLYPELPCMIITGYIDSEAMLEGFNKGLIHRYITKPWKKNNLLEEIKEAIQ